MKFAVKARVLTDTLSEITGTVAVTNANDTSAAAGSTTVTGTLARTNANDTSAASGTATVTGSLARTNANDSSAASGSPVVSGSLATTNADDSVAASGSPVASGSLAYTNADDVCVATGTAGGTVPSESAGGGGTARYGPASWRRKRVDQDVKEWVEEIYAELVAPEAPKVVREEAKSIVRPFVEKRVVDWEALKRDAQAIRQLVELWELDEEEDLLILMQ